MKPDNNPVEHDPDGRKFYWDESPEPLLVDFPGKRTAPRPRPKRSIDEYFASGLAMDPYVVSPPTTVLEKGREIMKHNRRVRKAINRDG